jgi:hypothetical protein
MEAAPAEQLAGFLAAYEPAVAKLARAARAALRRRFPTAIEQVCDNEQFLAIGYCSTERTSDCIVSLAVSSRGVALSFHPGAALPDPQGLLEGGGKQNRFLRLETAATLALPAVKELLAAAAAQVKIPLPATGRGYLMIKTVATRPRPRALE